jgi:hypothetical protein
MSSTGSKGPGDRPNVQANPVTSGVENLSRTSSPPDRVGCLVNWVPVKSERILLLEEDVRAGVFRTPTVFQSLLMWHRLFSQQT